jgi:hypothetical protein
MLGLKVSEVDVVEVAHELIARVEELATVVRMIRVRPRMARASLPVGVAVDRRRA